MLDASSSIPLYLQIRDRVLGWIATGELQPHDRLLSERELVIKFGVSRMTVHRTIHDLVKEGILYTRVGKGTFVSGIRFEQDQLLTGFTEEMETLKHRVHSIVRNFETLSATSSIAKELDIQAGLAVYRLERVRLIDDVPIAIETAFIPSQLCPDLKRYDFSSESLYAVLKRDYGMRLVRAEQEMIAALANEQEHQVFRTSHPSAVLRMRRRTYTNQSLVVEYVESVYRGDLYKLRTSLAVNSVHQHQEATALGGVG